MECFRLLLEHLAWIEHQFLSGIRDSRKAGSLWGMMRGVGGVRKSIDQSWLAEGLGLLCWGFKEVQEEILLEEASTLQIGSVAFPAGQFRSPQLHPCHRLFEQDGHQDSSSASLQSRPVTFGYSLSSESVVMRQLRRWKRLWRRSLTRSHKRTSIGTSRSCWNGTSALQLEEITLKGLEFHVCTINKSAHTKKSLETYLMILVFTCLNNSWIINGCELPCFYDFQSPIWLVLFIETNWLFFFFLFFSSEM